MNRIIPMLAAIVVSTLQCGFAQPAKSNAFSVEWLKEGLSIVLLVDSQKTKEEKTDLSPAQWRLFDQTIFWLNGFIAGANALCLADKRSDLSFPPQDWLDPVKIAPSILKHINENFGKVKPSTPARIIMASWYVANHPKSSESEKALSGLMLEN